MSEQQLHRLKTPRERDFDLFLATQMVEKIGYVAWESYQIQQHNCLMSIYDDFTWHLEQQEDRPNLDAELAARRLLTVELRIQFADVSNQMRHPFQHYENKKDFLQLENRIKKLPILPDYN